MTVLTQPQVAKVHQAYVAQCQRESITHSGYAKGDLDSAIVALDAEFENHITALNASLTEPFKSNATVRAKAIQLVCIIREKYGV